MANDTQSTHMSQVQVMLRKQIERARALVNQNLKLPGGPVAAQLDSLRKFNTSSFKGKSSVKLPAIVSKNSMTNANAGVPLVSQAFLERELQERLSDKQLVRIGEDVPAVAQRLAEQKAAATHSSNGFPPDASELDEQLAAGVRGGLTAALQRFFVDLSDHEVSGSAFSRSHQLEGQSGGATGRNVVDLVYKALVCRFAGATSG